MLVWKESYKKMLLLINTCNNTVYQPAQLFVLSVMVVVGTLIGRLMCPSYITGNKKQLLVLI